MSVFRMDLEKARLELKKARWKQSMLRFFTLGMIRADQLTIEAESKVSSAKLMADQFDSLLLASKALDDDLLQYVEVDGIRISRNAFADFPRIGAKGYPRDWEFLRETILTRDNYTCQEMSASCDGPLQIHHKISLSKGGSNSVANLISLCLSHHSLKHSHMRSKYFGNLRS